MAGRGVLCEFPECGVAISIQSADARTERCILAAASGQIYGNRLPRLRFTAQGCANPAAVVACDLVEEGERVVLAVTGELELAPFESDLRSLRWDLWKLVSSLLPHLLLKRRIATFHAACVRIGETIWLLPGDSGAGKSTLAFLARAHGAGVLASELSFVRDGALVAGNCVMCVERTALDAHGVAAPGDGARMGEMLLASTDRQRAPAALTGVAFPKLVTGSEHRRRRLSAARAQELLYDNAVSQLSAWHLFDAHGVPVGLSTPVEDLLELARETATVATRGGIVLEGAADAVWSGLADAGTRPG